MSVEQSPCRVDPKNFYGCYLLTSLKDRCKHHTYVGFTVDPNRRIRQHNGEISNGAWKTSKKRPWDMVLVVYGFPEEKMALRFEWAWQNPRDSRRLKDLPDIANMPKKMENMLPAKLKVLGCMLNVAPWNRLPLTVHWLRQEYYGEVGLHVKRLPEHIRIKFGPLPWNPTAQGTAGPGNGEGLVSPEDCVICMMEIENDNYMQCLRPKCTMCAHMPCLAGWFLRNEHDQCVPVEGTCPSCRNKMLWGDLVNRYHVLRNDTTRPKNPRRHTSQAANNPHEHEITEGISLQNQNVGLGHVSSEDDEGMAQTRKPAKGRRKHAQRITDSSEDEENTYTAHVSRNQARDKGKEPLRFAPPQRREPLGVRPQQEVSDGRAEEVLAGCLGGLTLSTRPGPSQVVVISDDDDEDDNHYVPLLDRLLASRLDGDAAPW